MPKKNLTSAQQAEKKQNRFLFACIANILYIIPCLSCLAMAILIDGFSTPYIIAIVTMIANLPVSLVILNRYKKKTGRNLIILLSVIIMLLHIISCPLLGTWYIIMAPSFVLYCLIIAWSEIVVNH